MKKQTYLSLIVSYGNQQQYDDVTRTWEDYLDSLPPSGL